VDGLLYEAAPGSVTRLGLEPPAASTRRCGRSRGVPGTARVRVFSLGGIASRLIPKGLHSAAQGRVAHPGLRSAPAGYAEGVAQTAGRCRTPAGYRDDELLAQGALTRPWAEECNAFGVRGERIQNPPKYQLHTRAARGVQPWRARGCGRRCPRRRPVRNCGDARARYAGPTPSLAREQAYPAACAVRRGVRDFLGGKWRSGGVAVYGAATCLAEATYAQ
jgi:hypothetical protein